MLPGKLYRFGNLNGYTIVWTSDWEQVLKRLKKDDVFLVLSCGKKHMGETIIKVLTSDGIVGYIAIDDRDLWFRRPKMEILKCRKRMV
jgi:hypothetical protein